MRAGPAKPKRISKMISTAVAEPGMNQAVSQSSFEVIADNWFYLITFIDFL
jgi:hypothetical protein